MSVSVIREIYKHVTIDSYFMLNKLMLKNIVVRNEENITWLKILFKNFVFRGREFLDLKKKIILKKLILPKTNL